MKKIYVIAGEASGDLHGANLIKALHEVGAIHELPLQIYGVGGDKIRATGALEFFDLAHFHVTGITQAIRRLPQYRHAAATILKSIGQTRPDLVVLIDNPGFNLHLAGRIHSLDIPVCYYIAPQVWAWAPKRVLKIKKWAQKVLVVFEFEKKIYEEQGIPVVWVGHPLKDLIETNEKPRTASTRQICLLPGSRKGELKMLFSVFVKAAAILARQFPGIRFVMIKAPTLPKEYYDKLLKENGVGAPPCGRPGGHGGQPLHLSLVENNPYETIRESNLAIVCSGTATLECALLGTPMIISNKGSFLTYLAAKSLLRVPYLGLPNLVLGTRQFPELLQYDATPEKIAAEAAKILSDASLRQSMQKALKEVSERLGPPGASKRAAEEILKEL